MGGKKTVEDSRRFEKDRRNKLNAAFEELCKLLPDHDPSVTLTKIEILKKAAQYIRHLQEQNDEIMKLGSDSGLRSESEKLRKRVTHLLLKTKELVDALRCAGVAIPNNKKTRKKKAAHNNLSNQNRVGPGKLGGVPTLNDDCRGLKRIKCGCMKVLPEKKPLKESNPVATSQSHSIGAVTSISSDGTISQSVLNGTNLIAVTPPLISTPIMATRIQSVPVMATSESASSLNPSPSIASGHGGHSVNSVVLDGGAIIRDTSAFKSNTVAPPALTANVVNEVISTSLSNRTISVVTATSSGVITTQSFVNSSQFINIPQNNVISNSVVAPRIQNVPVIEKNILSNLGPGTLILADGRIMNVPPIVPQIVVKPQPAVILMPTAKKKEKLIIPKRREVTKTTFANKAPIPAIQTFRLESCPRVRPKKKPKLSKKSEKPKHGEVIEVEQGNKKRKLDEIQQTKTSETPSRENSTKALAIKISLNSENSLDSGFKNSVVTSAVVSQKHSETVSNSTSTNCPVSTDSSSNSVNPLLSDSISTNLNGLCTSQSSIQSATSPSTMAKSENTINSEITTNTLTTLCTIQPVSTLEQSDTEVEQNKADVTEKNGTFSPEKNTHEDSNFFNQTVASSSVVTNSSSPSLISSDRNENVTALIESDGGHQESISNHCDVSVESSLSNEVIKCNEPNGKDQNDESALYVNNSGSVNTPNEIFTNIPPCISSTTEQDSIFVLGDKQILLPETGSSLSEGPVVNQNGDLSPHDVNKSLVEDRNLNLYSQGNVDQTPLTQSLSQKLKNVPPREFNRNNHSINPIKPPGVNIIDTSINSTQNITIKTSSDCPGASFNSESATKKGKSVASTDKSNQKVHFSCSNSQTTGIEDNLRPLNDQEPNFHQSRPDFYQASVNANEITTTCSFVNSVNTVPNSQNVGNSSSQGKNFTQSVNHLPEVSGTKSASSVINSNNSCNNVAPHPQSCLTSTSTANSQPSITNHTSYGIASVQSQKESTFFNTAFGKSTSYSSNEKNNTNYHKDFNSVESLSTNVFPLYSSSTFYSNGTANNSQNTFHLKSTDTSNNMLPPSGSRNADVYNSQTVPTDIGDKTFYPQNVSFPPSTMSRAFHWDKPQCNKTHANNSVGEATEELNQKMFYRNKNVSFEKQNEHSQATYFGFQNEPAVTSQSNTVFHNLPSTTTLPSSCDAPAVFSYHSSTSVASSYSFIPHENISSLNRSSMGGTKTIHQEKMYFPDVSNVEKNKGNYFRNNDKLNVGNIPFYPRTTQPLIPGVYPNPVQSNLSSVYSTLSQPNLPSSYTNSSQLNTSSAYSNSPSNTMSAYPNSIPHNIGSVYSSSSYPIVSSVFNNFSQPNASGVYTTSTISSVFTRSTQPSQPVLPVSSNSYAGPHQHSILSVKNTSSAPYLNANQHGVSGVYINDPQSCISSSFAISTQSLNANSGLTTSTKVSTGQIQTNSYSSSAQTNLSSAFMSTAITNTSNVYTSSAIPCITTSASLPNMASLYSSSKQSNKATTVNRYNTCGGNSTEPLLYQTETIAKTSEINGTVPSNSLTNSSADNNHSVNVPNKNSELILAENSSILNDAKKKKVNSHINCPTTLADSNLNDKRQSKSMQTSFILEKDVPKNKFSPSANVASQEQRPSDPERNHSITNAIGKENSNTKMSATSSNSTEHSNKDVGIDKYSSYDFVPNNGKDVQTKRSENNVSAVKSGEIVDKSIQNNFSSDKESLRSESNNILSTTNVKSVSDEVTPSDNNYNYNSQPNYLKGLQTPSASFSSHSKQPASSAHANKSYADCSSSVSESLSNRYNSVPAAKPTSIGVCTTQGISQSSQSLVMGVTKASAEHLTKTTMVDAIHRHPEKHDKSVQKSYEAGISDNLRADIPSDFLKTKDIERNTFIPIIDDVRLSTDFSSDLFSSLHVPTGGTHSESISPTAAFLLAFPLVSTSRNVESLQDNENHENQTSTPTTILQIGNIDPPSTELFHPIDFQKANPKANDHFDINSDYLHVNEIHDKQTHMYKRCEKRKDNFTEYPKEIRPNDPKQKTKPVVTTNTYTHTYSQPLLSCNEYQYCEKDSSQWQQEFSSNISKEPKKTCDRKKDKTVQKGCFHQTYQECYSYKDKKRKQQNRISVNWMTTPEIREQTEYQGKDPESVNNLIGPPSQSLYGGIPLEFPPEPFPDFCNTKKSNNYSWSPNKTLLPALDNHLMIPSTLPTLVGDLALGTSTPSESYKTYEAPKSQLSGQMAKKAAEKLDVNKKQNDFSKNQANFFSVSQLVDPKSKKQKTNDRNCKRPEKNSKPRNNFSCPKKKDDQCMYYEDRNVFAPNQNQYNEKRLSYKGGSYSAESLIGAQQNEIDFSSSFNYQQNPNYFQSEFPSTMESTSQQYGYFQQTHFTGFSHDECQEFGFSTTQRGLDNSRQKGSVRKDENYHGASLPPPQICPPYTKSINYNLSTSHLNTNTTTTLTNFNLSTIFPEINDQRVGTSIQPPQQMNSSYQNSQSYRNHLS